MQTAHFPDKSRRFVIELQRGLRLPETSHTRREPVHEITVLSPNNEMSASLLIYPDRALSLWVFAELQEEQPQDTFERFMTGKTGGR